MKNIILLVLIFSFQSAICQDNAPQIIAQKKANFSLEGIGISIEPRLLKSFSIEVSSGLGSSYDISEDNLNYTIHLYTPSIFVAINPKLFYNQKKRFSGHKVTSLNSGNYFGLKSSMPQKA